MRTIMAAALLTIGIAAPALADGGRAACSASPVLTAVPASTVLGSLERLGYRVDRMKAEHGCWKVTASNDSGYPIKALYHAGTGELMQARLARD